MSNLPRTMSLLVRNRLISVFPSSVFFLHVVSGRQKTTYIIEIYEQGAVIRVA